MRSDPKKAVDEIAKDTRTLEEGLETELRDDVDKAKGEEARPEPDATKQWQTTSPSKYRGSSNRSESAQAPV